MTGLCETGSGSPNLRWNIILKTACFWDGSFRSQVDCAMMLHCSISWSWEVTKWLENGVYVSL